jgi:hypothetical protein
VPPPRTPCYGAVVPNKLSRPPSPPPRPPARPAHSSYSRPPLASFVTYSPHHGGEVLLLSIPSPSSFRPHPSGRASLEPCNTDEHEMSCKGNDLSDSIIPPSLHPHTRAMLPNLSLSLRSRVPSQPPRRLLGRWKGMLHHAIALRRPNPSCEITLLIDPPHMMHISSSSYDRTLKTKSFCNLANEYALRLLNKPATSLEGHSVPLPLSCPPCPPPLLPT